MDQHLFWHPGFRETRHGQNEMGEMRLMELWPSPRQNQHLRIKSWRTNCTSFSVWRQISENYFFAFACHSEVTTDCTVWRYHVCGGSQHSSRSRCRTDLFFRTGGLQWNSELRVPVRPQFLLTVCCVDLLLPSFESTLFNSSCFKCAITWLEPSIMKRIMKPFAYNHHTTRHNEDMMSKKSFNDFPLSQFGTFPPSSWFFQLLE